MKLLKISDLFFLLLLSSLIILFVYITSKGKSGGDIAFIFGSIAMEIIFMTIIIFIYRNKNNLMPILLFLALNCILTWSLINIIILNETVPIFE